MPEPDQARAGFLLIPRRRWRTATGSSPTIFLHGILWQECAATRFLHGILWQEDMMVRTLATVALGPASVGGAREARKYNFHIQL